MTDKSVLVIEDRADTYSWCVKQFGGEGLRWSWYNYQIYFNYKEDAVLYVLRWL
jgi:hypothetical protein